MASSSAVAPSASSPRPTSVSIAARSSGSSRNSVQRLRSGALTSKNGFSVVAPMSVSVPSSTAGSRASCCDFEKRWISSRNRIVPCPCSPSRWRARSITSRTSFTPAVTARELLERPLGAACDGERERGLAGAGRPPEERRREPVGLDQTAQRPARPDEVFLADDVVERPRPQRARRGAPRLGVAPLRPVKRSSAHVTSRGSRPVGPSRKSTTWSSNHVGSTHFQAANSTPSGVGVTSSVVARNVNQRCAWPSRLAGAATSTGHCRPPTPRARRRASTWSGPSPVSSPSSRGHSAWWPSPRRCRPAGSCQRRDVVRSKARTGRERSTTATTPAREVAGHMPRLGGSPTSVRSAA